MADNNIEVGESDRLKERRDQMASGSSRRTPVWVIIFFLIIILLAAIFLVFPDQARRFLGLSTSSSADIQKAFQVDNSGISTQIKPEPSLDIQRPAQQIVIAPAVPTKSELNPDAAKRLADLEKALRDIANCPEAEAGPTANDIRKLLDQQAAAMKVDAEAREQMMKAQMDALRAQLAVPTGPSQDD